MGKKKNEGAEKKKARGEERRSACLKREGSVGDISVPRMPGMAAVHFVWKDVNRLLCRGDDGVLRLMKVNERSEG